MKRMGGHNIAPSVRRCSMKIRSRPREIDHEIHGQKLSSIEGANKTRARNGIQPTLIVMPRVKPERATACRLLKKFARRLPLVRAKVAQCHTLFVGQTNVVARFGMRVREKFVFALCKVKDQRCVRGNVD